MEVAQRTKWLTTSSGSQESIPQAAPAVDFERGSRSSWFRGQEVQGEQVHGYHLAGWLEWDPTHTCSVLPDTAWCSTRVWLDRSHLVWSDRRMWRAGHCCLGPGGTDEQLGRTSLLQSYTQVQNDANNLVAPFFAACFSTLIHPWTHFFNIIQLKWQWKPTLVNYMLEVWSPNPLSFHHCRLLTNKYGAGAKWGQMHFTNRGPVTPS